jgi:hypothetical protein
MTELQISTAFSEERIQHHRGPVSMAALFAWPPRPWAAVLSLTKRWLTSTRNVMLLLLSICIYNYLLPELSGSACLVA